MVEHFQNALSPKLANSQQLHRMGAFTLSDCRKHIFELLFDIPELVTCHTHLMNLTFSQGQNHYTDYVQNIAEPVLSMITNDFQELEKARVQIVHKPTKSHSPKPQLRVRRTSFIQHIRPFILFSNRLQSCKTLRKNEESFIFQNRKSFFYPLDLLLASFSFHLDISIRFFFSVLSFPSSRKKIEHSSKFLLS